jgi:hypothetical protein
MHILKSNEETEDVLDFKQHISVSNIVACMYFNSSHIYAIMC